MTDEELVVLVAQDIKNFESLVDRHRVPLCAFIRKRFGLSREECEDIVQEAFLRAYLKIGTFDPARSKWKTWLYQIAIHCACNLFRNPRIECLDDYSFFMSMSEPDPSERVDQSIRKEMLEEMFSVLDEGYRRILEMHYVSGMTCEQIGRQMQTTTLAVKTKLKYAERALLIALPSTAMGW